MDWRQLTIEPEYVNIKFRMPLPPVLPFCKRLPSWIINRSLVRSGYPFRYNNGIVIRLESSPRLILLSSKH